MLDSDFFDKVDGHQPQPQPSALSPQPSALSPQPQPRPTRSKYHPHVHHHLHPYLHHTRHAAAPPTRWRCVCGPTTSGASARRRRWPSFGIACSCCSPRRHRSAPPCRRGRGAVRRRAARRSAAASRGLRRRGATWTTRCAARLQPRVLGAAALGRRGRRPVHQRLPPRGLPPRGIATATPCKTGCLPVLEAAAQRARGCKPCVSGELVCRARHGLRHVGQLPARTATCPRRDAGAGEAATLRARGGPCVLEAATLRARGCHPAC